MSPLLVVLNGFLQATCVIIVIAYLLGRGQILSSLDRASVSRRDAIRLGVFLGIAGLSEVLFPGARYPYKTDMLVSVYGAAVGGLGAGLPCVGIIALGSCVLQPHVIAAETSLLLLVSVCLTSGLRRSVAALGATGGRVVLGSMAQAIAVFLEGLIAIRWHVRYAPVGGVASIPADALGLIVFQVFVSFGLERRRSEEARLDAERAKAIATQSQLAALRARVHPHFLYNVLTSIAGLCRIAPDKAERAIVNLGALMRNALESSAATSVPLSQEIANVEVYLEIEQNRLGSRLNVEWTIDTQSLEAMVPPFCVQTMVENAIKHGIAPKVERSELKIVARARLSRVLVAVTDSGVGMTADARARVLDTATGKIDHGLQLLSRQLELIHGRSARVRLYSTPDAGTLVVFAVPAAYGIPMRDR